MRIQEKLRKGQVLGGELPFPWHLQLVSVAYPASAKVEDDDKTYEEEEKELLDEDDGKVIEVDHKLQAQEFDFDSKFFSRFAVCTLLVGCYWFYPDILVSNYLPCQGVKHNSYLT